MERLVWVTKWSVSVNRGIIRAKTSDDGPCITFVNPWTHRLDIAKEHEWAETIDEAYRQAMVMRRDSIHHSVSILARLHGKEKQFQNWLKHMREAESHKSPKRVS